ncbi:Trm112 family protein [Glaesserella parasuis]|uniref:Trm112 family protein n=1 Tax=Glaesserella parasuis TaxID=738 RepID=UPI0003AC1C95|nr:Trm112 family protein [Glaesserella parasuis]EQA13198.1 trm112p-like family protein [Glaesserella parasuis 174]MDD2169299.1 Trm112 family protein [Glaesserella parasuis]MDP0026942.1 Trm112 family protein [Glaesserella parasuis]MDP0243445.1 Trm112 family protein [Glaesserella parasuis]MDP0405193.1 Trm112 family protein [Glaesserella parasuis]
MNEKLFNTIACPITQTKLEWDKENNRLISRSANVYYPIENGIPVLLPEKAEKL